MDKWRSKEKPNKPEFRRAKPQRRPMEKLASWLNTSNTKQVLVAFFAAIGFIGSIGSGTWTAFKEYQEARQKPEIRIRSQELGATKQAITIPQLLGMQRPSEGEPIASLGAELPTFSAIFTIRNPASRRITFTDCSLELRHDKNEKPQRSDTSLSVKALKERQIEPPLTIIVDPNTTVQLERVFVFNQINMDKIMDIKLNGSRQFKMSCLDEKQEFLSTEWSESTV